MAGSKLITTKQHIIIVGVMILTILYGGYTLFPLFSMKIVNNITGKKDEDIKTFTSNITADISRNYPTPTETYIINRAEGEWRRDPFNSKAIPKTDGATAGAVKMPGSSVRFHYTGYVETGNKKMAIINGIEYVAGDLLGREGYILETIFPDRVVIRNEKNYIKQEIPLRKSGDYPH